MSSCRCGITFTGAQTCGHCAECHVTFSTPRGFDMHRAGSPAARYCCKPDEVGLVLDLARGYECWQRPPDARSRSRTRTRIDS